ncbi:MAG: hypothetical protein IKQ71_01020 [Lachnospiraceae bacterium]|nr:hypothetical protein [Lachnospiraceae bacterium]
MLFGFNHYEGSVETMISANEYTERLLSEYSKTFDITKDYEIGGFKALAYGYFSTTSEKYVLNPKVNLWSINGFEHILFFQKDEVSTDDIESYKRLMIDHMAPELVCMNKSFPEKDHMYSYVTVAVICNNTPDPEALKAIKAFKYEKNYLLTIRGHVEGHLILMDLSTGKAHTSKSCRHLSEFYERIIDDRSTIA